MMLSLRLHKLSSSSAAARPRQTELAREGRYDKYSCRRPVYIAGSAMPMQKTETEATPRSKVLARI